MNARQLFYTLSIATLGLVASATAASAVTFKVQPWTADAEFNDLINTNKFDETWVVQSRIGNNASNGTQEVDILNADNNLLPVTQGDRVWGNNQAVNFKVEFDGSLLKYTVDTQLLSTTQFSGKPIEDLFFRVRSTATSSMSLSNLVVNGVSVPDLIADAAGMIKYLTVGDLGKSFTITGTSTMSWMGTRPNNSALAYQIKAGVLEKPQSVPEPASISLLSLGTLGLIGIRLRRQRSA
jgi:PEP-CTERM motif